MSNDRKVLMVSSDGCRGWGRGFVSRFFIAGGGRFLDHCGRWRWFGLDGHQRHRLGWLLFSGLLQFAERTVRAFVDAVETGFVTRGERDGA